jgi:hypothetical protein
LGSAIRGAFGNGLKKVVCINPSKVCEGCFAKDGCLFYDFFEKDFAKYRLNLELGNELKFDLLLFEEAALKAPYVVSAVYHAFKEIGITKKRIKPEFKLFFNGKLIYDQEFFQFENRVLNIDSSTSSQKNVKLVFKTPLRIKENNRFVREDVSLETLLRSIYHRKLKLKNLPIQKLPFTPQYRIKDKNLSFIDFSRYSNRQKAKMKFGGIMGYVEFDKIDEESLKLLKTAQTIGAGKQVTFGLGRIEIED